MMCEHCAKAVATSIGIYSSLLYCDSCKASMERYLAIGYSLEETIPRLDSPSGQRMLAAKSVRLLQG